MRKRVCVAIALVLFAVGLMAFWASGPAAAHEWYTHQRNPVTHSTCCGGHDCAPIPLDADWVQPTANGYHVHLTIEQAKTINPAALYSFDVIVPWAEVIAPPKEAMNDPALYHLCIGAYTPNLVFCLFAVPGI